MLVSDPPEHFSLGRSREDGSKVDAPRLLRANKRAKRALVLHVRIARSGPVPHLILDHASSPSRLFERCLI